MAVSAARSAAVTGSKVPAPPLFSTPSEVRKNGRIASPDTVASRSTKAAKSMAVMQSIGHAPCFFGCHVPTKRGIQRMRRFAVDIASAISGPCREAAGMTTESGAAPPRAVNPLSAIAIAVVATLGVLYIVSQFLRNSVGVIAPDLAAEIGLTPIEIGLLSSIYFFVFAATQLPLGVALDRFGPKLCMLVSIGFTVLGCALFAVAHDAGGLVAARALLGFGTASFLMAPVALYARWFPPERFSTFAGIQLGLGSLGAIFATAPLAYATASFGWRMTFLGVGVCAALIGVLVWLIVTDDPPGVKPTPRKETLARKRRRHLAGDPHAFDGPRLHGAAFELSELRAGRGAVGRAVSHPRLWLRPQGPRRHPVRRGAGAGAGLVLLGAERPAVRPLQGAGPDRRRHLLHARWCCWRRSARCRLPLLLAVFAMIGFSTGIARW